MQSLLRLVRVNVHAQSLLSERRGVGSEVDGCLSVFYSKTFGTFAPDLHPSTPPTLRFYKALCPTMHYSTDLRSRLLDRRSAHAMQVNVSTESRE